MDDAINVSNLRGHRPWFWGDGVSLSSIIRTGDSQARIDKCLNCHHAKCVNCLSSNYKPRTRPIKERYANATRRDYSLTIPYLTGEKTAVELSKELGIGETTVRDWSKKYLQQMADKQKRGV